MANEKPAKPRDNKVNNKVQISPSKTDQEWPPLIARKSKNDKS